MINIGIIGVGGVGGYLAARLASYYEGSSEVAIHLFARGETAEVLKRDGITLTTETKSRADVKGKAYVYSSGEKSPIMDYLFVCVKSYSIGSIISEIERCTDTNSVIVPFMNGVDGREELINKLPHTTVIDGCVYIISKIISPAVIEVADYSNKTLYYFGGYNDKDNARAKELESLAKPACECVMAVDNISERVWSKFLRISTASTLHSYHRVTNGEIAASSELRGELETLICEFLAVAERVGHRLPGNILSKNLEFLEIVPANMTTSMQRDFEEGRATELETITGYIVKKGLEYGVPTPLFSMMYNSLLEREA